MHRFGLRDPAFLGCGGVEDCGDPPALANLSLWFDANVGATSGGSPPTDGDPIDAWANQGAGTTDALATGAECPSWEENELNGLPVLRFNGSTNFMTLADNADVNPTSELTFFMVAKTTVDVSWEFYFSKGTGGLTTQYAFGRHGNGGGYTDFLINGTWPYGLGVSGFLPTVWSRLTAYKTTLSLGDALLNNVSGGGGSMVVNYVASSAYIGKRYDGYLATFDVAEFGLYNVALDSGDRDLLDDYLTCKYAL